MPEQSFQIEAIGDIYAQALINEAQKQNALEEVSEDVRGIGELLKTNPAFLAFTQAVTVSEDNRDAALEKIFSGRVHQLTLQTLKSFSRRDRLMFLAGFAKAFDTILRKMRGVVDVELTTASPLAESTLSRIRDVVGKSVSGSPEFHVTVNPALIGGITLRIGDTLMDGSVLTQLEKMREQLTKGGSEKLLKTAVLA